MDSAASLTVAASAAERRQRRGSPVLRRWSVVASLVLLAVVVVMVAAPAAIARGDPQTLDFSALMSPPSLRHWFGTDETGRDLYTRVVFGARYSVLMAVAVAVIAGIIGTFFGLIAGYAEGPIDFIVMRVVDVSMSFPNFILALVIAISLGRGVRTVVLALVLVWWPSVARMVRGLALSLKSRLYVDAARADGSTISRLIWRHVLPHMYRELAVRFTLDVAYALVAVTGLSFLGLGVSEPTPEWGLMVSNSREYVSSAWWYPTFPGLAIFVVALAFGLVGDELGHRAGRPKR